MLCAGQSLCSGCHRPRWDVAVPWGAPPPAPVQGPWRDRGALHQTEKRGDVSASRKHGRPQSHWRGIPVGYQNLLSANRGLPPQRPLELRQDLPCGTPTPPPSAHPKTSPSRGSSSLGTLLANTIVHRALSAPPGQPPAPSEMPGGGIEKGPAASPWWSEHSVLSDKREPRGLQGAVSAQVHWQPIRAAPSCLQELLTGARHWHEQ